MMRTAAAAATSTLAATGLCLATASPAQAVARCDNNGKPKAGAGSFTNNTDQTITAKGDRYVGKDASGKAKFKTVEVAVGRNGGKASSLCDVDFIKTGWDWVDATHVRVDGDSWYKIVGGWKCWNTPGTGWRLTCG
ncbi:hypothetical protein [Actinoplanes xinjiangensis]|uniref:hypothetical protein n=1 Tax=Actinoplanes xinjiangensis TaxID=512350 RepID=UPI00342EDB13